MPRSGANPVVVAADEVRGAVEAGVPVVALESTIFTHGLPRPCNLETAGEAERQLRDAGVVPATIGVVDGAPKVGLTAAEIQRLAADDHAVKLSTRDLPIAAARRYSGGTTVAATSYLAHHAGIEVFATGGLGGVHHGASTTYDESADLTALASTPILLVSAGVKSILDIKATLERMETLNIPVFGYRTTNYPGFYVADSGYRTEYSVAGPAEAAAVAAARDDLGLQCAVLVAAGVPIEHQLDPALHDRIVAEAWEAADREGISGHDITPYLLDHIQRATDGASLEVNVAVYRNNVAVAGAIAAAMRSR